MGEPDPDMLFYLSSRGIPADQAKQMLCQGFAQEVFDTICESGAACAGRPVAGITVAGVDPGTGER